MQMFVLAGEATHMALGNCAYLWQDTVNKILRFLVAAVI